jgi:hypothetical protein
MSMDIRYSFDIPYAESSIGSFQQNGAFLGVVI